jgi:superfamily II DNA or RNA helicase
VLGDGDWEPKGWINVGMVQTIAARLKQPSSSDSLAKQKAQINRIAKTKELLERFEFVILEEAHEASGNSYYDILKRCKNAEYRLALTATPFMKDDEEANMNLMACAGPIGIRVSEKQLIDSGILAKPYFKYLTPYPKPKYLLRTTGWGPAYRLGIVENVSRNALILREAIMGHKAGLSVLVLVKQKKHGKLLEQAFKTNGMRTKFIFGESTRKVRAAALNALEKGELDVLIGSNILDVGVDVPALGMVILAAGGKAEVELRQRIGRGLRAKKKGGNVAFVVDFHDKYNKHLQKHSLARRKIVEATPGFSENILSDGEQFPYELL